MCIRDRENPQHVGVLNAFAGNILHGAPLVADGREGIRGLTLSNAMHLSSWLKQPVEIPFDEELYLEAVSYTHLGYRLPAAEKAKQIPWVLGWKGGSLVPLLEESRAPSAGIGTADSLFLQYFPRWEGFLRLWDYL